MKAIHDSKTGTAAALMVFCVLTMSVLTVLMLGVSAYRNVIDMARDGYEERLVLSYIWTKIKNGDEAGMVYVTDFHGKSALSIDDVYDGVTFHTIIYHYEGWVYELPFESGLMFSPGAGLRVIKSESLTFEQLEGGLIKVSAGSLNAFISPRGKTNIASDVFGEGGPVR